VLSTVLSAVDLSYRIILVEDALCSSSDESQDAIINLYTKRFDIQVGVACLHAEPIHPAGWASMRYGEMICRPR
jgi:Isochorismatase family